MNRPARLIAAMAISMLAGAGSVLAQAPATPAPAKPLPAPAAAGAGPMIAVLQGLDKTTARVTKFEVPVGETGRFGSLAIKVRDCRKHPPEETPESAAFVEIDEVHPGDQVPGRLFAAWIFASSPALSALEHAVYDVWLLDCRTAASSSTTKGK